MEQQVFIKHITNDKHAECLFCKTLDNKNQSSGSQYKMYRAFNEKFLL